MSIKSGLKSITKTAVAEIKSHGGRRSTPAPSGSGFINSTDALSSDYKETPPAPKTKGHNPSSKV